MNKYRTEKREFARIKNASPRSCIRPQCIPPGMRDIDGPPADRESTLVHLGEMANVRHRAQSPRDKHVEVKIKFKKSSK